VKLGRDFNALWFGQSVSLFGNAVTMLALPSVAILALRATPLQVGILNALEFAAFPVLGLAVGVWADRTARRPIMITANLVRAAILASILVAALSHRLGFVQLAIAATILGIGAVFFEICYQSYLPTIVDRAALSAANSRLEFTRSIAQIGGNGLAGPLISAIGAPLALGVDAISFLVSTVSLAIIRTPEPSRAPSADKAPSFVADLREGLAVVLGSPVLRAISACTATTNFGSSMTGAVFLIFAYRQLHLTPTVMGIVLAAANLGFAGAALATWCQRRWGIGPTLAVIAFTGGIVTLCLPLASLGAPAIVLFAAELVTTFLVPIYNINQVSLRQSMVPLELQGRMNATIRTFVWGTMPLGALAGGFLGNAIGSIGTILVAGTIQALACLWIVTSPVIRLREITAPAA
jgi:MFS family permease